MATIMTASLQCHGVTAASLRSLKSTISLCSAADAVAYATPFSRQKKNICCSAKSSAKNENSSGNDEVEKGTRPSFLQTAAVATLATTLILSGSPAGAVLNKFEADVRTEFGFGSAAQYGSADLRKTKHANENFRRANFTSADMREADFSGSTFNGGYLEKAVAYRANFAGADFSDALMDRMVLNEADLTDAILVRTVLTRSDLGDAKIEGADFSDAVLDLPQKQALCKYAKGVNSVTGIETRESLGCSNRRRNAYGSPSSPLLSAPPEKYLDKNGFCDDASGLCKGTGF